MKIDLILAHFGNFALSVEPALSTFLRWFPDARVVLYTDNKAYGYPEAIHQIIETKPPYAKDHPRYGWRSSDLYRAVGLLESKADVAIYSDGDMYYYSDKIRILPLLAKKFGFCLPANPRILQKADVEIGKDSDHMLDESEGLGFAYNTTPLAFYTASAPARRFLESYVRIMRENPVRNPMVVHRAAMETGYAPYLLPFQWCLCRQHIGIGDEIVLHIDKWVADYYLSNDPLWRRKLRLKLGRLRNWLRLKRRAARKELKSKIKAWTGRT